MDGIFLEVLGKRPTGVSQEHELELQNSSLGKGLRSTKGTSPC